MLKILVYTDGKPDSRKALAMAAGFKWRLDIELAVITVRPHTPPAENPPPIGVDCPIKDIETLPDGIQALARAAEDLLQFGLLAPHDSIRIRYGTGGYAFACATPEGEQIYFFERYGHFLEVLNREVTEHPWDLLVISVPRRSKMGRFVLGDTARLLTLDLHTSLLIVREGTPDGRYLVCADDSPSARRIFSLLADLLPAIKEPLDLLWVRKPGLEKTDAEKTRKALIHIMEWIRAQGCRPRLLEEEREDPADAVLETAGTDATIVMGASLRHDVYRRMRGSFPLEIIKKTESSILLVKRPQEVDMHFMKPPSQG